MYVPQSIAWNAVTGARTGRLSVDMVREDRGFNLFFSMEEWYPSPSSSSSLPPLLSPPRPSLLAPSLSQQTTINKQQHTNKQQTNNQQTTNNQQQPTTTSNSQQQPTTANNNQQQPTTANNNQQQTTDTTVGLCISRQEAAEVYLAEELRHAGTNPTCEIHASCCTSH